VALRARADHAACAISDITRGPLDFVQADTGLSLTYSNGGIRAVEKTVAPKMQ
jgi:hypothetical protein